MESKYYYPFEEGDTYYTIEDLQIVESTWDYVSEEIYEENPKDFYFHTRRSAEWFLLHLKVYEKMKANKRRYEKKEEEKSNFGE